MTNCGTAPLNQRSTVSTLGPKCISTLKVRVLLTTTSSKGLPWITDYHVLRNKRFILTSNSSPEDNKVELWSVESGQVVKTWKSKTFPQVQKIISEEFDVKATIEVPLPPSTSKQAQQQTVTNPAIPHSWFSVDIRVGSLTIHLDEDTWQKGTMMAEEYE